MVGGVTADSAMSVPPPLAAVRSWTRLTMVMEPLSVHGVTNGPVRVAPDEYTTDGDTDGASWTMNAPARV
jgi:hypothetical protein